MTVVHFSVFNMNLSAEDVSFVSSQEDWQYSWEEQIGWIFINLFSKGKIVGKREFNGNPLKLRIESNSNFDKIELEFLDGRAMLNSGMSMGKVLHKVGLFSKFSKLDVIAFTKDGYHEHASFNIIDDWDDEDRPCCSLEDFCEFDKEDVDYVMVKFRNPKYDNSSDEEEEEDKGEGGEGDDKEVEGEGEPKNKMIRLQNQLE